MKETHDSALLLRPPRLEDGAAIWRLVRDSGTLELNSAYLYLMLCRNHAGTCVVAERAGMLCGFASAYLLPAKPSTLFLWQIGTAEHARGRGLALAMLMNLLQRDACAGVTHLETTVTPSNAASRALFQSLARRLGTKCQEIPGFSAPLFPQDDVDAGAGHESEPILHIGPFQAPRRPAREQANRGQGAVT